MPDNQNETEPVAATGTPLARGYYWVKLTETVRPFPLNLWDVAFFDEYSRWWCCRHSVAIDPAQITEIGIPCRAPNDLTDEITRIFVKAILSRVMQTSQFSADLDKISDEITRAISVKGSGIDPEQMSILTKELSQKIREQIAQSPLNKRAAALAELKKNG